MRGGISTKDGASVAEHSKNRISDGLLNGMQWVVGPNLFTFINVSNMGQFRFREHRGQQVSFADKKR